MAGYWQRPDETAKVMTADGFFRTGDIGVMDADGYIKIVDRKKDMILVSGFNVYPNEIEDVVASHPGVLECAVIGVPDAKSGEAVKAFVVKKDPSLTAEDIIKYCGTQLTGYKVPEADRVPDRPAQDQCRQDPAPRIARRKEGCRLKLRQLHNRHCERSEAIHAAGVAGCSGLLVASLLAMTFK